MTVKFANYSALSEATRQVSQETRNLRASFAAAKTNSQQGSKQQSSASEQKSKVPTKR